MSDRDRDRDWLAERFEAQRSRLHGVAVRMLGSQAEADDAVQEAWLRLSRADTAGIENLGGWLTTVVARVCLDTLRSRRSRREEQFGDEVPEPAAEATGIDPEEEVLQAESLGLALLVVLETLSPAERVAFVLHDMFAVPFDEIAPIVGRTPAAARQLASRARRRVQGAETASGAELDRRREVVDAFLSAARGGDLGGLLALLAPDVVVRADETAVRLGAAPEVRGAEAAAATFAGRAAAARPALVGGAPGLAWAAGGQIRVAFAFTIEDGRIVGIDLVADPESHRALGVVLLEG